MISAFGEELELLSPEESWKRAMDDADEAASAACVLAQEDGESDPLEIWEAFTNDIAEAYGVDPVLLRMHVNEERLEARAGTE